MQTYIWFERIHLHIGWDECAMYLGVRRSEIKEKETERRGMCTKRLYFV